MRTAVIPAYTVQTVGFQKTITKISHVLSVRVHVDLRPHALPFVLDIDAVCPDWHIGATGTDLQGDRF